MFSICVIYRIGYSTMTVAKIVFAISELGHG